MKQDYSNGIQKAFTLNIGGVEQYISIRGKKLDNPVLLVLHGGPGAALTGISHNYQRPWEEYYTVVNWDQRCSGKTATISGKTSDVALTVDLMVSDALQVTDEMRRMFGKDKIIVLGHSWGTMLGANLVKRYPDRFSAYISTGTMVNERLADILTMEHLIEHYEKEGKQDKVQKLKDAGAFYDDEQGFADKLKPISLLLAEAGYSTYKTKGLLNTIKYELIPLFKSPEYTLKEQFVQGYKPYLPMVNTEMRCFNVEELGYEYEMPVYYINGDHDWQTPYVLSQELYEKTVAPDKAYYTLHDCAHNWDVDAPEQMAEIMCGDLHTRLLKFL